MYNDVSISRFWSKVDKRGPDECWPWLATKTKGYGRIRIDGIALCSHRVALVLKLGRELTPGKVVRHSCDNPRCVNPNHLSEGTQLENMREAAERGRMYKWNGRRSGSGNPRATMTEDMVMVLRAEKASTNCTYADLAKKYGLKAGAVGDAVSGRRWQHLPFGASAEGAAQ